MGTALQKMGAQLVRLCARKTCLLCLIILILQPAIVEALVPFCPPAQKLSFIPGEFIEKELPPGETHSYAFELVQQSFLRIDAFLLTWICWYPLPRPEAGIRWSGLYSNEGPLPLHLY